jgi:hypothetical protein
LSRVVKQKSALESDDAAEGDGAGLAVSAADEPQTMEHAALRAAPHFCGAGAVQSARLLARLRQRALPPGAMLPLPHPCYWDRKEAMTPAEWAKADAVCRPLRALLSIGSLKGSEGLWLF